MWAVTLTCALVVGAVGAKTIGGAAIADTERALMRQLRIVQKQQARISPLIMENGDENGDRSTRTRLLAAGDALQQAILFRLVESGMGELHPGSESEKRALGASLTLFNIEQRYAEAASVLQDEIAAQRSRGTKPTGWLHNNLGEVMKVGFGRLDEAAHHYASAVAARPVRMRRARRNLGWLLSNELGRAAEAAVVFRRATVADPADGDAWFGLAQHVEAVGDIVACYWRALAADPGLVDASYNLGIMLAHPLNRHAEAAAAHRLGLAADPADTKSLFALAALDGRSPPADSERSHGRTRMEKAPDAYVEQLFDHFAPNFESTLRGLRYDSPAALRRALDRVASFAAETPLNVVDLGCGTGLLGAEPVRLLQNTFFQIERAALHTATARALIPAECSAVPWQVSFHRGPMHVLHRWHRTLKRLMPVEMSRNTFFS